MRSKPVRKNAHKERIFTQKQNVQDFDYMCGHRGVVDGKNSKILTEKQSVHYANCQSRGK